MSYMTIEQCIRANGDRHLANAIGYASKGNFAYSNGSLTKARRNYARADEMENFFRLSPELEQIVNVLRDKVSGTIMNGTPRTTK